MKLNELIGKKIKVISLGKEYVGIVEDVNDKESPKNILWLYVKSEGDTLDINIVDIQKLEVLENKIEEIEKIENIEIKLDYLIKVNTKHKYMFRNYEKTFKTIKEAKEFFEIKQKHLEIISANIRSVKNGYKIPYSDIILK